MVRLIDESSVPRAGIQVAKSIVAGPTDPSGDAQEKLGKQLQRAGDVAFGVAADLKKQDEVADEYRIRKEITDFEQRQTERLKAAMDSQSGDVAGFTDRELKPLDDDAKSVLDRVPVGNERLYGWARERVQGVADRLSGRLKDFSVVKNDAYHGEELQKRLDVMRNGIDANSQDFTRIRDDGIAIINAAPITAEAKKRLADEWRKGSAFTAFNKEVQTNPAIAGSLGIANEGSLDSYFEKTIGVESSGNPNAKTKVPGQSASGLAGFTDDTFIGVARRNMGMAGLSDAQILARKNDPQMQREALKHFTRENAEFLNKNKIDATHTNLYLAHFLGAAGAVRLLKSPPGASIHDAIKADAIAANKDKNGNFIGGQTVADVVAWAERKMGRKMYRSANVDPRFADLPFDTRQKWTDYAERQNAMRERQEESNLKAEVSKLRSTLTSDLLSREQTGQGVDGIDRNEVRRLLGEDGVREYESRVARADRLYVAGSNLSGVDDGEIQRRLDGMRPQAGAADYEAQVEDYLKLQKKADNIRRLRQDDPAFAVSEAPEVLEARRAAAYEEREGRAVITPKSAQAIIRARVEAQKAIGIMSPEYVTKKEANGIARQLRLIGDEQPDKMQAYLADLQRTYGDYTDEVLDSALRIEGVSAAISGSAVDVLKKIMGGIPPTLNDQQLLAGVYDWTQIDRAMGGSLDAGPGPAPTGGTGGIETPVEAPPGTMDGFMPREKEPSKYVPYNPANKNMATGGAGVEDPVIVQMPDGGYAAVPQVWYDAEGKPTRLKPDVAFAEALTYEQQNQRQFQRYATSAEASAAARGRIANPQADRGDVPAEGLKGTPTEQEIATIESVLSRGNAEEIARLEQEFDRKYGRGALQKIRTRTSQATNRAKDNFEKSRPR